MSFVNPIIGQTLFYCRSFNMQCVALVLTAPNVLDIHCGQYSLFLRTSPCNRHSPTFFTKIEGAYVDRYLTKEEETIEEAKERLNHKVKP